MEWSLRTETYRNVTARLEAMLMREMDWVSVMATVACELHHAFPYFHWTGFYRRTSEGELKVGPYQGSHGCLSIALDRGICGLAARTQTTQMFGRVQEHPDHIACSSTTQSEIVIPIVSKAGRTEAVIDIDSNDPDAFTAVDREQLERIGRFLSGKYFSESGGEG